MNFKSVLLVEDLADCRQWLCTVIEAAFPGCEITQAESVRQAKSRLNSGFFQLCIVDLGLPDGSGLEIVQELQKNATDSICVVASIMGDDDSIVQALAAGAQGYLQKEQPPEQITAQLAQLALGIPALSPSIARKIMSHFHLTRSHDPTVHQLSKREQEVLTMIAKGLRNREVADALGISQSTVSDYIKNVYRKLGITSRAEATHNAIRFGLLR